MSQSVPQPLGAPLSSLPTQGKLALEQILTSKHLIPLMVSLTKIDLEAY